MFRLIIDARVRGVCGDPVCVHISLLNRFLFTFLSSFSELTFAKRRYTRCTLSVHINSTLLSSVRAERLISDRTLPIDQMAKEGSDCDEPSLAAEREARCCTWSLLASPENGSRRSLRRRRRKRQRLSDERAAVGGLGAATCGPSSTRERLARSSRFSRWTWASCSESDAT